MFKSFYILLIFPCVLNSQVLPYLAIKAGLTVSHQIKTPNLANQGMQPGYALFIEPTFFTFGSKKQVDLNADFVFIQKNFANMEYRYSPNYTSANPVGGRGASSYGLSINYLSFSPTLKYTFWKSFFVKTGPRIDRFLSYKTKSRLFKPDRHSSDFSLYNLGVTYAIGIRMGKRKQFLLELMGQNDFTQSAINYTTGQTYKNMSYMLNFGMTIVMKKHEELSEHN